MTEAEAKQFEEATTKIWDWLEATRRTPRLGEADEPPPKSGIN
jgi:hypothetical protein